MRLNLLPRGRILQRVQFYIDPARRRVAGGSDHLLGRQVVHRRLIAFDVLHKDGCGGRGQGLIAARVLRPFRRVAADVSVAKAFKEPLGSSRIRRIRAEGLSRQAGVPIIPFAIQVPETPQVARLGVEDAGPLRPLGADDNLQMVRGHKPIGQDILSMQQQRFEAVAAGGRADLFEEQIGAFQNVVKPGFLRVDDQRLLTAVQLAQVIEFPEASPLGPVH
ncbi:hypothetical protein [Leisingera sp. ANG-Vp]|uniref:hypothetical protein n=1 Tax=Leisingera sp. ANG-Vp TaxID=1577896 RepID=UPI001F4D3066|nr:hypothetical protein [Leisingera sp. ANG-Vp]